MEWTVVGVISALIALIAAVTAPMLKLNGTITKLSTIIEHALQRLDKLEKQDEKFMAEEKESHRKLHGRINNVENMVNDHEKRIFAIEIKGEK